MSKITNRQLAHVAVNELQKGASKAKVSRSLANFLVAERRSKDLDSVVRLIEDEMQRQTGATEVQVISARNLSETVKKQVLGLFKSASKAEHIVVNEVIDPQVIGGVLVESPDHRLDLTVRRQLQRLKEMGA